MTDLLTTLLEGEQQTIYAYGVLGARLTGTRRELALAGYDAHRLDRDALISRMRARSLAVPPAAAGYAVSITGAASAVTLAVRLETSQAVLWRDLVGSTDERELRMLAVRGLTECAVRATQWRVASGLHPVTDALPGQV